MNELNFSAIGDSAGDIEEIGRLVKEFQAANDLKVNIMRLPWDRAWQALLMTAMEGKGGDVSQVGSTWAPTLAALDSLRWFSEAEVRELGGPLVFAPAVWQTVRVEGVGKVWAIPWSVYTFVIFYRRDLLQKAGVDETTAFATPESMLETFQALQGAGITPWTVPTALHYFDLPHIASSWVRAYGGDFISADGRQVIFNSPHARQGLVEFFSLYRFLPKQLRGLSYEACLDEFFCKGNTAVMIAGVESYSDALANNVLTEELRDQIGVACVPGVPWIGGDHLVAWRSVRTDPEKERAALALIKSLASAENQIRLHRETTILPARLDAYPDLEFRPDEMRPVLERILQVARPHPPTRLWRRIESMLVDMLFDIGRSVMDFQKQEPAEIVEAKLADYERRFSLVLGG
ncbi:MAG: extracellular solute-binding protein [Chloroflexi bacterium]|nr:extracellular solute-binding protein [Chloroflexota bacterium]